LKTKFSLNKLMLQKRGMRKE